MRSIIKRHRHHFELMVMLVIFIVFFGLSMYLLSGGTFDQGVRSQGIMDYGSSQGPSMMIKTATGMTDFSVGDEIELVVTGDSKGVDINGFDVLLGYDTDNVEMLEVLPVRKDYQAFTFPNDRYVSVTVTKLLESQMPGIFGNEDMLQFKVKANRPGTYDFRLMEQQGNEKTKMVDTSTGILVPSLNTVSVTVR